MGSVLNILASADLQEQFACIATTDAIVNALRRASQVERVQAALRQREITESDIRDYVRELMQDFRPGERFQHEAVLAALVVSLEHRATSFSDEFINELAGLQVSELARASRIARKAAANRHGLARTARRIFTLTDPVPTPPVEAKPRRTEAGVQRSSYTVG